MDYNYLKFEVDLTEEVNLVSGALITVSESIYRQITRKWHFFETLPPQRGDIEV